MKKEDKTKTALKLLFNGQTEEEIDQLVKELKLTLDEASEEAKGELDLGGGVGKEDEEKDGDPTLKSIGWIWDPSISHGKVKPLKVYDIPTGFEPASPLGCDSNWHDRYAEVEESIFKEYDISRNLKNRDRKIKINRFLRKMKLSVFSLSTDKEVKIYNRALANLFLRINLMDDKSLALKDERVAKMRAKSNEEQLKMRPYAHEPVIYAKPL